MPAKSLAKNSFESHIAANEPLTIFGDIGELANSKLDPNASFFSRVSKNRVNKHRKKRQYLNAHFGC